MTWGCWVEMPPAPRGVLRGGEKCNAFVYFCAADRWMPGMLMGRGGCFQTAPQRSQVLLRVLVSFFRI